MSSSSLLTAQILGISTSLLAAGGILSISLFVVSPLTDASTPTSTSAALQSLRFNFSRGSHVFPQVASLASAAFAWLAYHAPPSSAGPNGYIVAALGCISIAPFTIGVMLPATNGRLRELMARDGEGKKVDGKEVEELVRWFGVLNYVRGALMLGGGLLGLWTALTER